MITINFEAKVKAAKLTIAEFHSLYIDSVLNYKHNTHTKNKGDIFNIGYRKNDRLRLEDIFFKKYTNERDLKTFVDTLFGITITSEAQARNLLTKILVMSPYEIDARVMAIKNDPKHAPLLGTLGTIFNYDRDNSTRIRPVFSKLDFSVCFYCNRNYISGFTANGSRRALFTLDHYYHNKKFPLFSLSLYNLIPSCSSCNSNIKSTNSLEQYKNPYCHDYDFHSKATFKLLSDNSVRITSKDSRCSKYIKDFYINEVYQHHKPEIKEFVTKRLTFTDDLLGKLSKMTGIPLNTTKALVFGDVIHKNALDLEPLSKLKVDLAKALHIIS